MPGEMPPVSLVGENAGGTDLHKVPTEGTLQHP